MIDLLVLDNYDSFTYNLVHLIQKVSPVEPVVRFNDQILLHEIASFDKILLSPGPGLPSSAGIMPELIQTYFSTKSIFGVCLGMQAIGECFNSPLKNLPTVFHGKATSIKITDEDYVFEGCPSEFNVGRYHSWVIDETRLHPDLLVTARDSEGLIMAVKHKKYDVRGVQFHPESILSEQGEQLLKNWILHPTQNIV